MTREEYLALPYTIRLRRDDEGDWIAEIDELEGCAAHGDSREEALVRLDEAKTLWIDECLAHAQPIPQPEPVEELPSGRWVQRVPRSVHKNLTRLAKLEGTSLNQLVSNILSEHIGARRGLDRAAATSQYLIYMNMPLVTFQDSLAYSANLLSVFARVGGVIDYKAFAATTAETTK
jgi:antitoxin HicB